jgi:hypothetical protein
MTLITSKRTTMSCREAASLLASLGSLGKLSGKKADAVSRNCENLLPYVSALTDFRRASDAVVIEFAMEMVRMTRQLLAGKRPPPADAKYVREAADELWQSLEDAEAAEINVMLYPVRLSRAELAPIPAEDREVILRFLSGK